MSSGDSRALFYSHNGVGVGHLQRQLDLAAEFKRRHPEAAVLVVTGSHAAGMFPIPTGVDYVKLPAITMVDRYETWEPRELPLPRSEVMALRRDLLERLVRGFRPDLLVADFMPTGPFGELLPALDALDSHGGVAVAGFRDVIDDPAFVRDLWKRSGVYDALERRYRAIAVYGSPEIVDFASAYGLQGALAAKLTYTGLLGRDTATPSDAPMYERPLIVANGGGGADGRMLLELFIEATRMLRPSIGGTWLAVTGPLMDADSHAALTRIGETAGATVRRIVPELRAHIALADCVVSMAGYNTCCDLLTFRRPSVLLPRAAPSREQAIRAGRLREWGAARVLESRDPNELAAQISAALAGPAPSGVNVPLDGLSNAIDLFDEMLGIGRRSGNEQAAPPSRR